MRRTPALVTAILVGVALLVGPAGSGPATQSAARPASYGFLKAVVFSAPGLGDIAVGMPTPRVVKVQHRVEGGAWSRPKVLFRKKGVTCGEIGGRTSPGGVALILECDRPYYEDQAPVQSRAFVTRDLTTWASRRLDGEAHHDPAISTDGSYAVWLVGAHGSYLLHGAGTGFSAGRTSYDYDSGGETVVVDDAGTVTVMGPDSVAGTCALVVHDQPLSSAEDVYVVQGTDPGCTEGGVRNVDDRTVVGSVAREHRFVVGREPGERWRLTRPAPVDAPGLVTYRSSRRKAISNLYSDADRLPLVSVGSPDRQRVMVQVYDDDTGSWSTPETAYDHGFPGCTAVPIHLYDPVPSLHSVELRCYPKPRADGDYPPGQHHEPAPRSNVVLLTSHDADTWTTTRLGRRPYALSGRGRLLAAPGRHRTTVVSPTGTVSLPVSAPGRCDFVFPIGPDSVLRLHGGPDARWPTRLQKSVARGPWKTIQTVRMPSAGRCTRVQAQHDPLPSVFFLRDRRDVVSLAVKRDGEGGWHVERFRF